MKRTDGREKNRRSWLDAHLDEALAQTFPASDPFSVGHFTATEPPARPVDTKPPLMTPDEASAPRRRKRKPTR